MSRYNFHCIVTQMASSPFPVSAWFFFFIHFFFTFLLLENHLKNISILIFFSHFPVHPKKFIKIYFIYFFSVLHTIKTLEKYFFSSFFFHFCYWKTIKIYIYIYIYISFSNEPNKFLKIYFIHFFSFKSGLFAQNFSNTCSHTNPSVQHFILFPCAIYLGAQFQSHNT